MAGEKLNEINLAQEPAKELLRKLGYTFVPPELLALERDGERDVLLRGRLREALLRLNPWLTKEGADRAIFQLERVDALGLARNKAVYEYLTYGMPIDVDSPAGRRTRTVHFFDFDHSDPRDGRNEYLVTTQMRVRRGNERASARPDDDERLVIPDLVLFVNGIPLVVLEVKAPTLLDVWKTKAVRQLLRYQEAGPEWHGRGAPELFAYNLLCVALGGTDAAYAATGAPESGYAAWKSVEPFSEDEVRQCFGAAPEGQAALIVGLLAPATLLDILRDYVVYEPEKGRLVKKLPRYQQYRAVKRALARILHHDVPQERGGVIWHTQGSGKSLTMLWLATKLRREPRLRNPTIVIVTDRRDLDKQIADTFRRCGFETPERATSTRRLCELLTSAAGRTVTTTIQKFEEALQAPDGKLDELTDADNVFVMVDEAHRTQYGALAAKMRAALPRATFIGFTGTPIDKRFRSTMREFGDLLDEYTIPQAVADGATVPIFYEARLPDLSIQGPNTLDRLFEAVYGDRAPEEQVLIRRRFADKETIAGADRRIEAIALDIHDHYTRHIQPNGFKAQVIAPNRRAALRYAEKLNEFPEIDAYPIITTTGDDNAEFDPARFDQEAVIERFKSQAERPNVLVVVDMLLTGFDAPIEQVLYLDRGLREHGLLQAIARVNRRGTGIGASGQETEKTYGLIVDYWGVSQELGAALADFEPEDLQGTWEALPEPEPGSVIDSVMRQAEHYFGGRDLRDPWNCLRIFQADARTEGDYKADLFERFNHDYRHAARLLDRYLPDPQALPYLERLVPLTKIRLLARATFLRESVRIAWSDVSAKVRDTIDRRIDAEIRRLMEPVSILDADFEATIAALPHDEARASVMEHAIRAQIKERLAENPVFYGKLSEQLEQVIAEMRQHLIDAVEAVKHLGGILSELLSVADIASQRGLSEVAFAFYQLLEQYARGVRPAASDADQPADFLIQEEQAPYRATLDEDIKRAALAVETVVQRVQGIVDWQRKDDVLRLMRRDIKRELRRVTDLSEEQINVLAANMVEVARRQSSG